MSATTATVAVAVAVAVAGIGNKYPFTSTQWQELEHQALIYKYMAAGIPIPPDLLFSIKRSLHSSLSSGLFPYQSSPLGWNPYQMGYGKKIDPEPGRCRRTDGKKWRCSKEAYPDSKYCERHMHRGKNRSRKPVESPLTNNTNTNSNDDNHNNTITSPISAATNSVNAAAFSTANLASNQQSLFTRTPSNSSSLYSFSSSDSSYNASSNAQLLYSHGASYAQKDYRDKYYQGMKEEVGEHAFFTENTGCSMTPFPGSSMDESWQLGDKQSGGYPNYLQSSNTTNNNNRDFSCDLSIKIDQERSNLSEKTTHHFFDEWPIKTNGGRDDSSSTTQLSISIPNSASHPHDFFLSDSRNH